MGKMDDDEIQRRIEEGKRDPDKLRKLKEDLDKLPDGGKDGENN